MKFLINLMLYSFLNAFVLFPLFDLAISDPIHWDKNIILGIIFSPINYWIFPLYEGK